MNRFAILFAVAVLSLAATACHHRGDGPDEEQAAAPTPIPAGSPLAKLKQGMSKADVEKILGQPTHSRSYLGGKAFNPFNFGGDTGARVEALYKGKGRVVYSVARFSQEMAVEEVVYDPNESGQQK